MKQQTKNSGGSSHRRTFIKAASAAAVGMALPMTAGAKSSGYLVYIGTYTNKTASKGIYRCRYDEATGELKLVGTTQAVDPSFLAIDSRNKYLFAASEIADFQGRTTGAVSSYRIDQRSGDLEFINREASEGAAPCYVSVDAKRKAVLVANYSSGSVSVLPVSSDGKLSKATYVDTHKGSSINPDRQKEPHAHSILLDDHSDLAFSADLGTDRISIYRLDAKAGKLGILGEASLKPGAGPRHIAIHPSGKLLYVINELDSTITSFRFDRAGAKLSSLDSVSTLPADFSGKSYCADIHIHPSGRFLYGSNRGHNSIAVFAINPADGKLSVIQHQSTLGNWPRNFALDPSGKFLLVANQNSGNIASLAIDQQTGKLSETRFNLEIPAPVCVKFMPFKF